MFLNTNVRKNSNYWQSLLKQSRKITVKTSCWCFLYEKSVSLCHHLHFVLQLFFAFTSKSFKLSVKAFLNPLLSLYSFFYHENVVYNTNKENNSADLKLFSYNCFIYDTVFFNNIDIYGYFFLVLYLFVTLLQYESKVTCIKLCVVNKQT